MKNFKRPKYVFKRELKKEFLRGLKLSHICEATGISYSYLSSIVRGVNTPDMFVIYQIMDGIGYTKKEIYDLIDYFFVEA